MINDIIELPAIS